MGLLLGLFHSGVWCIKWKFVDFSGLAEICLISQWTFAVCRNWYSGQYCSFVLMLQSSVFIDCCRKPKFFSGSRTGDKYSMQQELQIRQICKCMLLWHFKNWHGQRVRKHQLAGQSIWVNLPPPSLEKRKKIMKGSRVGQPARSII